MLDSTQNDYCFKLIKGRISFNNNSTFSNQPYTVGAVSSTAIFTDVTFKETNYSNVLMSISESDFFMTNVEFSLMFPIDVSSTIILASNSIFKLNTITYKNSISAFLTSTISVPNIEVIY